MGNYKYSYSDRLKLYEEGEVQQQQPQPTKAPQQTNNSAQLAQKLVQLKAEIDAKEKEFNEFKAAKEAMMNQIRQEAAKMGVDLTGQGTSTSEGVNYQYRFSKALYESLQSSKADELAAAVKSTFDNLDSLSYYMDDKACTTFAKRLLAWLNEQNWNDGQNHWEDTEDKIRLLFTNGNISMSRREINDFCEEFKTILSANTVFGWIFGNKFNR